MNPEKKKKVLFVGGSLLLAGALGTLIYYQQEGIEKRRTEVAALKKTIEEDKELLQKTPDLVKQVIIQRETDSVIKQILSDEKDVNELSRTLNRFAQESGFTFSQVKDDSRVNKKSKDDFERVSYTLSFEADAFQLLTFLNKLESHTRFMSVTTMKLSAAGRNEYTADSVPRHRLTLDLETYVYAPTGNTTEVKIDQYEKKRDLLVSEISKRGAELRIPAYEYRGQRARRDPWIDPRVPVDGGPTMPIEEQIALVDGLAEKATEIDKIWGEAKTADNLIKTMKLRSDLEERLGLLEEEIRRVDAGGFLVFVPALKRYERGVVEVVRTVRDQMSSGEGADGGASTALLRETSEAMDRHIQAQEYELALQAFNTVESRLGLADQDPLKEPMVKNIRELRHLADTVLAFEAVPLDIQGVALYEGRAPVVLINGEPLSEGEMIGEELLIQTIAADRVEFAFRGLILARSLKSEQEALTKQQKKKKAKSSS
ncbi:MAG: GspMb/PilO family protein [Planctomycetota bacterium]